MSSQTAKRNRFAERVRAVEDFETEPVEPMAIVEAGPDPEVRTSQSPATAKSTATKNKTIELRIDTISTLKNAVNWQKLLGDGPQTEKDIIEAALGEWFEGRGYPRKA